MIPVGPTRSLAFRNSGEAQDVVNFVESGYRQRLGGDVDLIGMSKKLDASTMRWYIEASRYLRAEAKKNK